MILPCRISSTTIVLVVLLFALGCCAFAGKSLLGAFDLAFQAFDAAVVTGGVVDLLLAVAGLATGAAGIFDVAGITFVVSFLRLALAGNLCTEVDKVFAVVFYAHNNVV